MKGSPTTLAAAQAAMVRCTRCPELRSYCAAVALRGKKEFAGQRYWGKPVPGLGDERARLLIVGLAPAAHGGNRTGRMFTGDGSAGWLAPALHRAGFATQPISAARGDGFALIDAYLSAALRCAPPHNKPTRGQLSSCADHMRTELRLLPRVAVVVGLGKVGFDAAVARLAEAGYGVKPRPRFAHLSEHALLRGEDGRRLTLLGSYHPSRQNTNTGKLTQPMLDAVFRRARALLGRHDGD